MSEHTPTPWKQNCFLITGPHNEHITHTGMGNLPPSRSNESEANAAFIVKAVNNHEAMDKLLAEAADYLNTHPGMDGMDLGNKITQFRLRMQADLISPARQP